MAHSFGAEGGPTVLLTAMIHGVELIGGLSVVALVRSLLDETEERLLDRARVVVVANANPDGVAATLERRRTGRRGGRRGNARGVDLNRNFPPIGEASWHPFAGSRWPLSPHYMGPHPFSEPETRALRALVLDRRPDVAVGFHSFGELLLYPWAHTAAPHPRRAEYEAIGEAFRACQRRPYRVGPSMSLYPTIGDMDDWLDETFGTLAFTVEVGRPRASLLHADRAFDSYFWMNPPSQREVDDALADVVPATRALLAASLGAADERPLAPATTTREPLRAPLEIAAAK